MIIDATRKTTREHHNPVRRIRVKRLVDTLSGSSWADCKELTIKIKQGETLKLWR